MTLKTLLARNRSSLALLIGNGINRYGAPTGANSWEALLSTLARSYFDPKHKTVPGGISLTEFYDVLELANSHASGKTGLQQDFCDLIKLWVPQSQHRFIVNWAQRNNAPLLTTNFDSTLSDAVSCVLRRIPGEGFTFFYPWESYYGPEEVLDPCAQFAIWHINGMRRYRQSIRLGLSHYMGSVERARRWFQRGNRCLFNAKDDTDWFGASSWLQIFLHKPLLIVGLGLTETEVFLRWLLIERARYFKKFPARKKPGWYVHTSDQIDPGKKFFLQAVGIQPIPVTSHYEVYAEDIWNNGD